MAGKRQRSSTGPPKVKKATARQLRMKAELILKSRKNANVLCEILEMFNRDDKNFTPVLLTVEMIFCTLLRRGDMYEEVVVSSPPPEPTPEVIHARWLRSNYDLATARSIACMKRGEGGSRIQALVTCCKMMVAEGINPMKSSQGSVCFPDIRLRNIFDALLDTEASQTPLIYRFQEYTEYRDVQQRGLKMLSLLAFNKEVLPKVDYHTWYGDHMMPGIIRMYKSARGPSEIYMQNFLELFDVLMKPGLNSTPRPNEFERHEDDKYLVEKNGAVATLFNPESCKWYINRCWGYSAKWPLRATEKNHRIALIVLVDRIMPYLYKPALATDLLCDSLDCGSSISMIALRGMMDLSMKHKIDFPDIYDRLYGMFEPEMFATRSKKRLIHLADIFLSSNRLSATLVAAFAKRIARLALIASPEDASDLLQLVANVIHRHPSLKKMLRNEQPAIMPKDPYVMEETFTNASRAIKSSLWEVSALQQHFTPEMNATAKKVLASADSGARAPDLAPAYPDQEQFDMEIKKRFKTIEMNFVRVSASYYLTVEQRLNHYWDMAYD